MNALPKGNGIVKKKIKNIANEILKCKKCQTICEGILKMNTKQLFDEIFEAIYKEIPEGYPYKEVTKGILIGTVNGKSAE